MKRYCLSPHLLSLWQAVLLAEKKKTPLLVFADALEEAGDYGLASMSRLAAFKLNAVLNVAEYYYDDYYWGIRDISSVSRHLHKWYNFWSDPSGSSCGLFYPIHRELVDKALYQRGDRGLAKYSGFVAHQTGSRMWKRTK